MRGIKNIRLPNYDYRKSGYYFVTVNTAGRKTYFIEQAKADLCRGLWGEVIARVPGAKLDIINVLPNHRHVIIVLENAKLSLGEIVRRCKARTTFEFGHRMWQPNYYEHVIRTEKALHNIRNYIQSNREKHQL